MNSLLLVCLPLFLLLISFFSFKTVMSLIANIKARWQDRDLNKKLSYNTFATVLFISFFIGVLKFEAFSAVVDFGPRDLKNVTIPELHFEEKKVSVQSETINGILVPPEPDPKINNATLAGIDVNNNGVRDDIERFLAGGSKKSTFDNVTLKMAFKVNQLVTQDLVTGDAVVAIYQGLYCLDQQRSSSERGTITLEDIIQTTMNTLDRSQTFQKNRGLYLSSEHKGDMPNCNQ